MTGMELKILSPLIQFGFAGTTFILMFIVMWLIKKLLDIQRSAIEVIDRNTSVIEKSGIEITTELGELRKEMKDQLSLARRIHEHLIKHGASHG